MSESDDNQRAMQDKKDRMKKRKLIIKRKEQRTKELEAQSAKN